MPNPSRSELCHCAAPHASCSIAHRKRKLNGGKILTPNQNNAGVCWKREWLLRQQPERKEKHRNGQCRANHEQRLSTRHEAKHDPSTIDGIRRHSVSYALTHVSLQLALSVPATSQQRRQGMTCKQCGKAFMAPRNDARFCSSACRQRAYRIRTTR
jgi:hypothetical protein